jgi:hypothetical protein
LIANHALIDPERVKALC